jgi:glucose/arabinose dehydrogenase
MKKFLLQVLILLFSAILPAQETVLSQPRLSLQTVIMGFSSVTDIANAGDNRLFIVEQAGRIWILDSNFTRRDSTFLNIATRVNSSSNEQGLLGLAFHPDFASNGFFYVNYTFGVNGNTRISRFNVSAGDPDRADPDSEVILMTLTQPFANHNGGDLNFGPDGYLYIGMGDGGGAGDPGNRAQNKTSLMGKILRIDVDGAAPYEVPATNPFVGDANYAPEIWALGLRNPWRFSFDRESGDMWIADVGQNAREEINFQAAASPGGENYGWRCYEGNNAYNTAGCSPQNTYKGPVYEYNHVGGGRSVTGGYVYRGEDNPGLLGRYIMADFIVGEFFTLTRQAGGTVQAIRQPGLQGLVSTFGENYKGEIFGANRGGSARIFKVNDACNGFKMTVEVLPACDGDDGSIALDVVGATGNATVVWNDLSDQLTLTGLTPGDYSVTITDQNNCTIQHAMNVVGAIAPVITYDTETFVLSSSEAVSYQWYKDGSPYEIDDVLQTGQTTTATGWGSYYVVVVDDNGCETASDPLIVELTRLFNHPSAGSLSIFPNPAGSMLQFRYELTDGSAKSLVVINATGIPVLDVPVHPSNTGQYSIDISALPAGAYFLRLLTQDGGRVYGNFLKF